MSKRIILSLLALLCASQVFADAPKFQKGDRVVFVGDSITHGGDYHMQTLLFYVTRLPNSQLKTWNCGSGGDSAWGANQRFAWDIAARKPTAATVMMGMNDVNRELYEEGQNGEKVERDRAKAIIGNTANMEKLVAALQKDGARVTILSPSPFDQTGTQKKPRLAGVNDALKACAEADAKIAEEFKTGFVDFNGPMTKINDEQQKKTPDFTLIGPDRVHPGPVGHLVMAYLLLKAQGFGPEVATMDIDAAKGGLVKQGNCEVANLTAKANAVSFECLEQSLPFPVDPSAAESLKLIPFIKDLNQELLRVSGLTPGNYEISIDGKALAIVDAKELLAGVNLALLMDSPQMKQAYGVLRLLKERQALEGELRNFAQVERQIVNRKQAHRTLEGDVEMVKELLEKEKTENGKYSNFAIKQYEFYIKRIKDKPEIEKTVDELLVKAYASATPGKHAFAIRRAEQISEANAEKPKLNVEARIVIYGDKSGVTMKTGAGTFLAPADKGRKQILMAVLPASPVWKDGALSFTPENDGEIEIQLTGAWNKGGDLTWTLFKEVKATGIALENGAFEKGMENWTPTGKPEFVAGTEGAPGILKVSVRDFAAQRVAVKAGEKVGLTFNYKVAE